MNLPFPTLSTIDQALPDYRRERLFWRERFMDLSLSDTVVKHKLIHNLKDGEFFHHELAHIVLALAFLKNGEDRPHQGFLETEFFTKVIEDIITSAKDFPESAEDINIIDPYHLPKWYCLGNYTATLLWLLKEKTQEDENTILNKAHYDEKDLAQCVRDLGGYVIIPGRGDASTAWRISLDGNYYQYDSSGEYENNLPDCSNFRRYSNPSSEEAFAILTTAKPAIDLLLSRLPSNRNENFDYESALGQINLRELANAIGIPTPAIPLEHNYEAA